MKEQDVEEVRKKFFAQVQEEYENFRFGQISGGIERAYKNSLKITFYKEVYRYLMDDVLHDEEYIEFLGEPIIYRIFGGTYYSKTMGCICCQRVAEADTRLPSSACKIVS